jgi:hypothetical protein
MIKTHDQRVSRKASFELITASDRTAGGECPSLAERSSYLRLIVDAVKRKDRERLPELHISPATSVYHPMWTTPSWPQTRERVADLGFA